MSFTCPCCGAPSEAGLLFPMCGPCAHDVPRELLLDVVDGMQASGDTPQTTESQVVLVWVQGESAGLYVESDSLSDYGHGVPTAHWSTEEEAADFVGCPGWIFIGGPLAAQAEAV